MRTMEFCRRWGIVPWVENARRTPRDYPQDYVWVSCRHRLGIRPRALPDARATSRCPPQSPQKRERCPQNMFDPILARFAQQYPHVSVRYDTELVALPRSADGVRRHRRGRAQRARRRARRRTTSSAAMAARSTVRQQLASSMAGKPAADVHDQRDFRCAGLPAAARQGARAIATSSSAPRAPGARSWRSTAATTGASRWSAERAEARAYTEAEIRAAHRSRRGPRVRVRDPVDHALDAARAGGRQLRHGPRLHRGRCRAPDFAHRRLRHEHGHAGCGRSRLEAGGLPARLGRAGAARRPTRSSAGRWRSATSQEASGNLDRMLSPRDAAAAEGVVRARRGRRARRARSSARRTPT